MQKSDTSLSTCSMHTLAEDKVVREACDPMTSSLRDELERREARALEMCSGCAPTKKRRKTPPPVPLLPPSLLGTVRRIASERLQGRREEVSFWPLH